MIFDKLRRRNYALEIVDACIYENVLKKYNDVRKKSLLKVTRLVNKSKTDLLTDSYILSLKYIISSN